MRLIWSRQALRSLAEIRDYIARDKPDAARMIARRLIDASELLLSFPGLGRTIGADGERLYLVAGTPYLLRYFRSHDTIAIIDVIHGRRRR
jgi:toxin ParE1/3/4